MNKPAPYPLSGQFTTKAVSQATGLSVETLRAWERRYEVVQPCRDAGGRRSYTATDVGRLRLLRTATELGHTISRLAKLDADELAKLVAVSGGHHVLQDITKMRDARDRCLHHIVHLLRTF